MDKVNAGYTYDITKNIKDIELNAGFILGLESIIFRYIDIYDKPMELVSLFKKFNKLIKNEMTPEEANLNDIESELYTLFVLQQIFKAKAYQQGLMKESDIQLDKMVVEELLSQFSDGNIDKVKEITDTIMKMIDASSN